MRGWDMRIKLGFSFVGKKKGLLADSFAIAALAVGADEEEGALDESEAMSNQENEENHKKISVWQEGKWEKISSDTMQNDKDLKGARTFINWIDITKLNERNYTSEWRLNTKT